MIWGCDARGQGNSYQQCDGEVGSKQNIKFYHFTDYKILILVVASKFHSYLTTVGCIRW